MRGKIGEKLNEGKTIEEQKKKKQLPTLSHLLNVSYMYRVHQGTQNS